VPLSADPGEKPPELRRVVLAGFFVEIVTQRPVRAPAAAPIEPGSELQAVSAAPIGVPAAFVQSPAPPVPLAGLDPPSAIGATVSDPRSAVFG